MFLENSLQRIDLEKKASAEQRLYSTSLIGSKFSETTYSMSQYKQDTIGTSPLEMYVYLYVPLMALQCDCWPQLN